MQSTSEQTAPAVGQSLVNTRLSTWGSRYRPRPALLRSRLTVLRGLPGGDPLPPSGFGFDCVRRAAFARLVPPQLARRFCVRQTAALTVLTQRGTVAGLPGIDRSRTSTQHSSAGCFCASAQARFSASATDG
jgi:hypothetical protein